MLVCRSRDWLARARIVFNLDWKSVQNAPVEISSRSFTEEGDVLVVVERTTGDRVVDQDIKEFEDRGPINTRQGDNLLNFPRHKDSLHVA